MRSTTLMDCIQRVPALVGKALADREASLAPLMRRVLGEWGAPSELFLVGSGTSHTAGITAQPLAQRASGLRVTALTPNALLDALPVLPASGLYLFVSQTGTSTLTREALRACQAKGLHAAVVSQSADTPIAAQCEAWIDMGCGDEEYPMRTIGYSLTVTTLALAAMELGRASGWLDARAYERLLTDATRAAGAVAGLADRAAAWADANRRKPLRSELVAFTAAGDLYGVALEAAVKTWEIPQIVSVGYELEEGMHGPNYGYGHRHCLMVLCDGVTDAAKGRALCRYMKNEFGNGFWIGPDPLDGEDFAFAPQGGAFQCLEYAAVVQTLAYRLAVAQGRDLMTPDGHEAMYRYFNSHDA